MPCPLMRFDFKPCNGSSADLTYDDSEGTTMVIQQFLDNRNEAP
jgi:hypothetical protein